MALSCRPKGGTDSGRAMSPLQMSRGHKHCLHRYRGVLHMALPDGHVVLKCCDCEHYETRHEDHAGTWHNGAADELWEWGL